MERGLRRSTYYFTDCTAYTDCWTCGHGRLCTCPWSCITATVYALLTSRIAVRRSWASRYRWKRDGHDTALRFVRLRPASRSREVNCVMLAARIVTSYFSVLRDRQIVKSPNFIPSHFTVSNGRQNFPVYGTYLLLLAGTTFSELGI